jgi:molybdate transport system substrate-binding protein
MKKCFLFLASLLLVFTSACAAQPTPAPISVTLTVMAAASLTESFSELGLQFEEANPGVQVQFNFSGSQQLAMQLSQGAQAEVFASANQTQMDFAVRIGRVEAASPQIFAQNRLVVVYPQANPGNLSTLADLVKPGLKIILANREVPVGEYSIDFLDKAVKDPQLGAGYQTGVLKNVVSFENSVKGVLTKVVLGEADAGIVYTTDIIGDAAAKVGQIEIPEALNVIADYPIAVLKDSPNQEMAKAFVDMVLSPQGQSLLESYGFMKPGGN